MGLMIDDGVLVGSAERICSSGFFIISEYYSTYCTSSFLLLLLLLLYVVFLFVSSVDYSTYFYWCSYVSNMQQIFFDRGS
jgi:hypothetical protein